MPLEAPKIETPSFEQLVRMAQLRVPRYTPEWTDFNESDPGNTLIQLFAWLTEMMLVQMNRLPDRNYIKFLQLLGLELRPAQPASAHLTFTVQEGAAAASILPRTRLSAQAVGGGNPVIFETLEGLDLIRAPLSVVQVFDGGDFSVLTETNDNPGTTFRPLGWLPQVGNALYLGFTPPKQQPVGGIFPQEMQFRVFLQNADQAGQPFDCRDLKTPPEPPVALVWEYKPRAAETRWRRLNVFKDESLAFTREGYISVQGPRGVFEPSKVGKSPELLYWIRIRLAERTYPPGRPPVIDSLRPNTVEAESLSTARDEFIGESEGVPDQTFTLRNKPVLPASLSLWLAEQNQSPEQWTRVDDFFASNRESKHFTLNRVSGAIKFGDGIHGLIPPAGTEITARHYLYGGGNAGNVPAGAITTLMTPIFGVDKVTNERPAVGGRDEQAVEELKREAPNILRSQNRAVSSDDYAAIALQAGQVAKAKALPLRHPDHPGVEIPGAITVVVVPDAAIEDPKPEPSADLLRRLCQFMDQRRLLTTELYVKGPAYQPVRVQAVVAAQPYAAFDDVERRVIAAINEYLDPLGRKLTQSVVANTGQTLAPGAAQAERGRRIGDNLFPTNLIGVMQRVADVVFIKSFTLIVDDNEHTSLNEAIEVPDDGLLYGVSDHDIEVVPHTEP